jgi:glucose-1-phosphate thymidylyltransferase
MKALVLAGGAGTRLRPITHTSAKQLVPVANKAVLFYGLESIAAAGITDVGVIVGDTADEIRAAVGDGSAFGLDVTYIPQDKPLGLAHAVLIARDCGITEVVDEFRRTRPDAQILLTRVSDPRAFGVAELDAAGQVVALEEKPEHPRSDLALVGVYLLTPAIHDAVRAISPSRRGELEITHALQHLIDTGAAVRSTIVKGYWKDTGNVVDMLEVDRTVLENLERRIDGEVDDASETIGRVVVERGARVVNSRIVGPVVIGAGTEVVDSYVGPFTSVAENCRIADSELEFSIVLRESSIEGVGRIEESLIGRHVEVTPAPVVPGAHRLVLGDHSKVQIHT